MSTDTGEPHLHGTERDESTARDDNARIVARDPEAPGMERVDVGKRARVSALRTALPPERDSQQSVFGWAVRFCGS